MLKLFLIVGIAFVLPLFGGSKKEKHPTASSAEEGYIEDGEAQEENDEQTVVEENEAETANKAVDEVDKITPSSGEGTFEERIVKTQLLQVQNCDVKSLVVAMELGFCGPNSGDGLPNSIRHLSCHPNGTICCVKESSTECIDFSPQLQLTTASPTTISKKVQSLKVTTTRKPTTTKKVSKDKLANKKHASNEKPEEKRNGSKKGQETKKPALKNPDQEEKKTPKKEEESSNEELETDKIKKFPKSSSSAEIEHEEENAEIEEGKKSFQQTNHDDEEEQESPKKELPGAQSKQPEKGHRSHAQWSSFFLVRRR